MASDNPVSLDLESSSHFGPNDTAPIDFVIPLSPGERILLAGIDSTYFSLPDDELDALRAELEAVEEKANITEEPRTSRGSSFGSDLLTSVLEQLHISADETGPLDALGSGSMDIHETESTEAIGYMRLFRGWAWGSKVESFVVELQDGESDIIKDFDGDRVQAFLNTIHWLQAPYRANVFRTNMLLEHNADVCQKLASITLPLRFHFVPLTSDIPHWGTLVGIDLVGHRTQLIKLGLGSSSPKDSGYDIWKVVQQFSLDSRRPNNPEKVLDHLIRSIPFQTKFVIRKVPTKTQASGDSHSVGPTLENNKWEIVDRQAVSESSMWAEVAKPSEDPSGEMSRDTIRRMLRGLHASFPLEDPRDYVEVIPWEELVPISSEELNKDVTKFRSAETDSAQRWMLWKPPSNHFFDSHHLHTEDEVYQYCLVHSWMFPGHSYRGAVIFALSPLEHTKFVNDLRGFWKKWNDCALTVDSTGQVYLLETSPGRQYRARYDLQGFESALLYFRTLVEDHIKSRENDAQVKAILDTNFDPQYQTMLRYLQPEEFVRIDPTPFASGANGAIYSAIWKQSVAGLCSLGFQEPEVSVVLKQIRPKFSGSDSLEKIIHELHVTFAALEGHSIGCVDFLGISQLWVSQDGTSVYAWNQSANAEQKLFLVFQRASEGDLLDFLFRELQSLDDTQGWALVARILSSIALGLDSVHKRGIVHGDLHPANILVTKQFFPTEVPGSRESYQYLLSDFGQGKVFGDGLVTSSSNGRFLCAIGPYIAPEVLAGESKSAESDVYSFGRIGRKIINLWRLIRSNAGMELETVPTVIKDILDKCLIVQAAERPNMRAVVSLLDDLEMAIDQHEAEWSPWIVDEQEYSADEPQVVSSTGDIVRLKLFDIYNTSSY